MTAAVSISGLLLNRVSLYFEPAIWVGSLSLLIHGVEKEISSFVLEKLEAGGSTVIEDLFYVKTLQHVLISSLQCAFERYNVEEVLGVLQSPQDQPEMDPDDLVYRLAHIIDQGRHVMSDGILIAL
ncbi:hypothetical protein Aduo_012701 [Ancylostoma duodenale]